MVPVIVPEGILVHVLLEMLRANVTEHTANATLHQRPEPFDGVGVNAVHHVDAGSMENAEMLVADPTKAAVDRQLVAVNRCRLLNRSLDDSEQRLAFEVRDDYRLDTSLALCHSEYDRVVLRSVTALPSALLPAYIALVDFDIVPGSR
jgi:hypothetical protein